MLTKLTLLKDNKPAGPIYIATDAIICAEPIGDGYGTILFLPHGTVRAVSETIDRIVMIQDAGAGKDLDVIAQPVADASTTTTETADTDED